MSTVSPPRPLLHRSLLPSTDFAFLGIRQSTYADYDHHDLKGHWGSPMTGEGRIVMDGLSQESGRSTTVMDSVCLASRKKRNISQGCLSKYPGADAWSA